MTVTATAIATSTAIGGQQQVVVAGWGPGAEAVLWLIAGILLFCGTFIIILMLVDMFVLRRS